MENIESFLRPAESASLKLRALYSEAGYRRYKMERFEEYKFYQKFSSFIEDDRIVTFNDLDGRLMALKPDVTLSIAKSASPAIGETLKYYYSENVYRPSSETRAFREIHQLGIEVIGKVGAAETAEAIDLACKSMGLLGEGWAVEVGHMGFISELLCACGFGPDGADAEYISEIFALLKLRDADGIKQLILDAGKGEEAAERFAKIANLAGEFDEILPKAGELVGKDSEALKELAALSGEMQGFGGNVRLDLSLTGDMEYYNGIVFTGYMRGVPRPVIKGGRYDPLAGRFVPGAGAVGFAVYMDEISSKGNPKEQSDADMLCVALPKGRIGNAVYKLMAEAGAENIEDIESSRELIVVDKKAGLKYFLVKPSDVAVYVERGAADVGIVGKDILEETSADVFELLDTGLGKCRMCVCAPKGFCEDEERPLRVATKFENIAKAYFASEGREIDIIKLHGSIEIAPLLGLSDVIVDIVETGGTLRANGLVVLKEFMPISARFIANKSIYPFKHKKIASLAKRLKEAK